MCYNTPCHAYGNGALFISSADVFNKIAYWVKHPVLLDFRPAVCVTTSANNTGCFAMSKTCSKCGSSGPFHKEKRANDGLTSQCRKCINQQNKKRYYENKEVHIAKVKEWQTNNKNKVKKYKNKWKKENREKVRKHNRDKYWRDPNKQRKASSLWRKQNPEKHRHHVRSREYAVRGAEGSYTQEEWIRLCEKYDNKCLRCGSKNSKLTVDHIVPISKGGSNNITNIQPLCFSCNASKQDKTIDYRENGSIERWIQGKLL